MSVTNSLCESGEFFNTNSPLKNQPNTKNLSPDISPPLFVHMNTRSSSLRLSPVAIQSAVN